MPDPGIEQSLIEAGRFTEENSLPADFGERLDPYVRERFAELWRAAQFEERG